MLPREPNPAACLLACKMMLWPPLGDVWLLRPCGSGLARVQRAKCGRLMSGGLAWLRAACGCLAAADGAVAAFRTPYALENLYPSTVDWTYMLGSCVTWTGQNLIIYEKSANVPFFMEMGPDYNQFACRAHVSDACHTCWACLCVRDLRMRDSMPHVASVDGARTG